MDRYTELTPICKTKIVQVSHGIDGTTRRGVIVRAFSEVGVYQGVKEFDVLTKLAENVFVVQLVEKIVKERTSFSRSGAGAYIVVSEALDTHLAAFLHQNYPKGLPERHVRSLAFQVLSGLQEIHDADIFVRNLRPGNIRVSKDEFRVKISDFTCAKILHYFRDESSTPPKDLEMDDLRYQAPELLVGSRLYTSAVDLWAVGCILVEMTTGIVLFGDTVPDPVGQLLIVFSRLGTPPSNPWPKVVTSTTWSTFPDYKPRWDPVADAIRPILGQHGVDLITELLCIDPSERITARDALVHPFFTQARDSDDGEDNADDDEDDAERCGLSLAYFSGFYKLVWPTIYPNLVCGP